MEDHIIQMKEVVNILNLVHFWKSACTCAVVYIHTYLAQPYVEFQHQVALIRRQDKHRLPMTHMIRVV